LLARRTILTELELVDFVVVESVGVLSVVGAVVVVVKDPPVLEEPLDDVSVVPARGRPVERAIMAVPIKAVSSLIS
jgi:hypothetical protein